ncbi:MAG: hypothetical protein WDM91_00305 [Rhizomicrobium sp.]
MDMSAQMPRAGWSGLLLMALPPRSMTELYGTPQRRPAAGAPHRPHRGTATRLAVLLFACVGLLGHPALAQQSCVEVEVEGQRRPPLDCLNRQLQQASAAGGPSAAIAAVVGNAEPNRVGIFSHAGTAIRMGAAFGRSATPQRPSSVYAQPVGAPRP